MILWQDPATGRTLRLTRGAPAEAVALLEATVWGGGGLRYRLLGLPEKLARLRDPCFAVLERAGRVESVMVLDRCVKRVGGREADAVHFAMAATVPDLRGEGLAGRVAAELRRWCEAELRRPGFAFAYVESTTEVSLRISDAIGHALERELALVLVSRLRPRPDPRVGPMAEAERAEVVARLDALHAGSEFADFDRSLRAGETLVLRDAGRIAAAITAEPIRWKLEALPGAWGALALGLLPRLPRSRRPLDPENLHAVRFAAPLVEPGREAALVGLLETALAREGAKIGLLMMDAESEALGRIRAHGRLGPLSVALKGSAKLRADFVGLSEAEIAEIAARPALVSPADVI